VTGPTQPHVFAVSAAGAPLPAKVAGGAPDTTGQVAVQYDWPLFNAFAHAENSTPVPLPPPQASGNDIYLGLANDLRHRVTGASIREHGLEATDPVNGLHPTALAAGVEARAYEFPQASFALACRPLSGYFCKQNAQQSHHRAKIRRRLP
jgi:hypothetical protein